MANYIVGDIQGCYSGLRTLLDKVDFNPNNDKLWAVGDLVARGPESLQTLEYLYDLGDSFDTVLGNHDLHFLAIYSGVKPAKKSDLLEPLLKSNNVERFVEWLRHKPLAVKIGKGDLLSHAGLYPSWSLKQAVKYSHEVQAELAGNNWQELLRNMYGSKPNLWHEELVGYDRLRFIINAFTRMRFVTRTLQLEFSTKTSPEFAEPELIPWYAYSPSKIKPKHRVFFGHWAALDGNTQSKQFVGLDTGYVWGNKLSMHHYESQQLIQIDNVK